MAKTQVIRHRLILGLLLITGAALFMWAQDVLAPETAEGTAPPPYFGYSAPTTYQHHCEDDEINIKYDNQTPTAPPFLLIGLDDVIFTPPMPRQEHEPVSVSPPRLASEYIDRLMSFDYLASRIFLADRYTALFPSDIDTEAFLEADLRLDMDAAPGPKVLIFHTHSQERFIDSNPLDPMDGVVGLGRALAEILANDYGIEVMHYTGQFDVIDGVPQRRGAYERVEPVIKQILADNPSVQMVIDIHRDGVRQGAGPFVTYIDGQRTAQIMFFNGLSRQNRNGRITTVEWLPNHISAKI